MLGKILIVVFTVMPLWWWRFDGSLYSLGQASALMGIVLFSINFILAGRYFFLEYLFGGLNKVYKIHHLTGKIAYSLIFLHPTLILISLGRILTQPNILLGTLAFVILSSLIYLTLVAKLKYDVWKKTHQFMSIALLLGAVHAILSGSTINTYPLLKIYMMTWVLLALVSAFIRLFNIRLKFHGYNYKVTEILDAGKWVLLKMEPLGNKVTFVPGQFVFLSMFGKKISQESHPFSLAGSSNDNQLFLGIKKLGDYTETMSKIRVGDKAYVEGAYGKFSHIFSKKKKQIWIAGGIGVTPFRSMAMDALEKNYEIYFYYSINKPDENLFDNEFQKFKSNSFKYELWITQKRGRITAENMAKNSAGLDNTEIFICGPVPMMRSLAEQFGKLGVKPARIHTEEFGLY